MTIITNNLILLISIIDKENMKQVRQTLQKEITYNTIMKMMGHPTAEEVYDSVHLTYPHVSKATVYRNLASLEEKGVIKRIPKLGGGSDRYDKNMIPHFHAKCKCCGKIFDVALPLEGVLEKARVMEDEGFSLNSYHLIFEGTCTECRLKEK